MIICIGPDGEGMGLREWRERALTPGADERHEHEDEDIEVEVSWLGICSDSERPPKPWLVQAFTKQGGRRTPVAVRWCPDRTSARETFERWCREGPEVDEWTEELQEATTEGEPRKRPPRTA